MNCCCVVKSGVDKLIMQSIMKNFIKEQKEALLELNELETEMHAFMYAWEFKFVITYCNVQECINAMNSCYNYNNK
ncbi:hypothetical protein T4A_10642 [Trichinella pseudospiralis]|uniref:Uncharacterized protein n=1 Tax=Trichinella pseudospiralis TaxID=6337 RepID=A0A0V1E4W4_TRIPS|nr:hypothetical protein T4A_10642 [Trichinella pseudospiralis]